MSLTEILNMVRMLMDDSQDWYPTNEYVMHVLNQAQLQMVEKAYQEGQEQLLRPLYETSALLANSTVVAASTGEPVLYPRTCRYYANAGDAVTDTWITTYVTSDRYNHYAAPGVTSFPMDLSYTLTPEWDAVLSQYVTKIYFTGSPGPAIPHVRLLFIRKPATVGAWVPPTPLGGGGYYQNLEVPAEYHFEACTLTAELLNDIDVGERERSERLFQNQFIPIQAQDDI